MRRAMCGFVFQFPAFLDDLTVAANVAVPLVVSGASQSRPGTGLAACWTGSALSV